MDAITFRDATALGHAIRRLRKAKGWSQADLARLAGTDARQVSRIETAAHEPKLSLLLAVIAVFLAVSSGSSFRNEAHERELVPQAT